MLRKPLFSSLLALGLTFAPAIAAAGEGAECHQGQLSLQALVDKHLKAVGGKEQLKAMKTLQITALVREGDTVTTNTVRRARPNLVRYDVDKSGTRTSKMFDGQQGWLVEGSGAPQRLDAEKSAMVAEGAVFDDSLVDPKARGVTLKLDGVEQVNGAPAFKVVITHRDNTKETRFLDQQSFLEVRRTYVGTHEGKPLNKTISFSDYRSVDGIMLSHRSQWESDGKKGEKVIQSARYDAPIEASVFKPAAPQS